MRAARLLSDANLLIFSRPSKHDILKYGGAQAVYIYYIC